MTEQENPGDPLDQKAANVETGPMTLNERANAETVGGAIYQTDYRRETCLHAAISSFKDGAGTDKIIERADAFYAYLTKTTPATDAE